jgi:hypothetical protein
MVAVQCHSRGGKDTASSGTQKHDTGSTQAKNWVHTCVILVWGHRRNQPIMCKYYTFVCGDTHTQFHIHKSKVTSHKLLPSTGWKLHPSFLQGNSLTACSFHSGHFIKEIPYTRLGEGLWKPDTQNPLPQGSQPCPGRMWERNVFVSEVSGISVLHSVPIRNSFIVIV